MYVPPGVNSRKLSVKSSCTKFRANLCRAVASFPALPEVDILTPTFQKYTKDETEHLTPVPHRCGAPQVLCVVLFA